MTRRHSFLSLVCLVATATLLLGAPAAPQVAHADAAPLTITITTSPAQPGAPLTVASAADTCPFVDGQPCTYEVRWGAPDGSLLCSYVETTPGTGGSCDGQVPATATPGAYTLYVVPVADASCPGCANPADSGTMIVVPPPGQTDAGAVGDVASDPAAAAPPDPAAAAAAAADAAVAGAGLPEVQALALAGADTASDAAAAVQPQAVGGTPACQGAYYHPVSNVYFRTLFGPTLNWDFYLTNVSRSQLGFLVTVSMPFALVNGRAINPPYAPHSRFSTYDFHGSFSRYQLIGAGGQTGTLRSGDVVTLFWTIAGLTGASAYRYTACRIP